MKLRSLRLWISVLWLGAITVTGVCGAAVTAAEEIPVPHPPMGWSSWNSFSNEIDSAISMAQARAMAANGMKDRGYEYVNIDEGWWLGDRDGSGNIVVDPRQWPALAPGERAGDMSNIVKYIHSLGLKAGIYTDAGESGCSFYSPDLGPRRAHTGSEGHYAQDFLQFAIWGFDYVKVDWCGGATEHLDPAVQYAEVARAIHNAEVKTGHRLYYSICNWGEQSPWTWAPGIGGATADIWRTSGDIVAPIVAGTPNASRRASFTAMLGNFDKGIHPEAQHTGFYNDPDMMLVGMPGLSTEQSRVHMTLWAIAGAPLIVGADLTKLSPEIKKILTNPEVIAVDQDLLGVQCAKADENKTGLEVWSKRLASTGNAADRRAVVLLNRTTAAAPITVRWSDLGLESPAAKVRDLWKHRDLKLGQNSYTATVPAGDAVMLLVEGKESSPLRSATPVVTSEQAPNSCAACSPETRERVWTVSGIAARRPITWVRIAYSNRQGAPCELELRVNGERQSIVALPSTKSDRGTILLAVKMRTRDRENTIALVSTGAKHPTLISIAILPGA